MSRVETNQPSLPQAGTYCFFNEQELGIEIEFLAEARKNY